MPRKAKAKTTKKTTKTTKKTKQTGGSTPAPVEAAPAPAPETVKQSGGRAPNPWLVHVQKVKAENPELKYKDVLVLAKGSYTKVSKTQ